MASVPNPHQHPKEFLRHLFEVAVARAQPLPNMAALLPAPPQGRTLVLGAGKAAGAMAHALEQCWPADAPLEGMVVTRYQHTPIRPHGLRERIQICEAAHPVPDQAGMDASARLRCTHRRNEHGAQTFVAHQGRQVGSGLSSGQCVDIDD